MLRCRRVWLLPATALGLILGLTPMRDFAADFTAAFGAADAYVEVGNYGPALREYHRILYQAEDAAARDRARYGIALCHYYAHDFTQAETALRELAGQGSEEWAPAARLMLARMLVNQSKHAAAMAELEKLIAEHPRSPQANEAHHLIGKRLVVLGRFEAAVQPLEMVGTAFQPSAAPKLTLEPGEPLFVQIEDADLYAAAGEAAAEAEISTERGEKEKVRLRPLAGAPDVFIASIPTALGKPAPGNGTVEVCGSDTVTVRYLDAFADGGKKDVLREGKIRLAANASLQVLSADRAQKVEFLLLDGKAVVQVRDPDCDASDQADPLAVRVATLAGEAQTLALTETAGHSGVFEGTLTPSSAPGAAGSGRIQTRAGDRLEISYNDERRTGLAEPRRTIAVSVEVLKSTEGTLRSLGGLVQEAELERMTAMERGKSYFIIGKAHDQIGLREDALDYFRRALGEFDYVLKHTPAGSAESTEALQTLWKVYLEQGNWDAAFATCVKLLKQSPESPAAVNTLLSLATEIERKDARQSARYYRRLVDEFPQSPAAAEAQYRLAADCKRQAVRDPRMKEPGVRECQRLIELFPASDHVPEALSYIASYYYDSGDYAQALEYSRRLASSYAASTYVDEGVVAEGKSLLKLGRTREALTVFRKVVFDNPDAKGELEPLMQECEKALKESKGGEPGKTGGQTK
jgi:tetratricopeptide (TPR) repeat protein